MEENFENSVDTDLQENANDDGEGLEKTEPKEEKKADTEVSESKDAGHTTEDIVPENYDFTSVKLPEGMELDNDLTAEFSGIAKDMGLSQEKADKLMGMGIKLSSKLQERFEASIKEAHQNQIKAYKTMLNTDPEIGGAKLKQSLLEANAAYDAFVSEEAAKLLSDSGLNNHPAIVKVFRKIGKQIKDDTIKGGNNATHTRTAEDWYPEMKKGGK